LKRIKEKIIYGGAGASGGLAGLTAINRCGGGDCSSCFGCAIAGLAIVVIALAGSIKKKKEKNNGDIQRTN
jgi:hypothetical protein